MISIKVIINDPEDTAGSTFNLVSIQGTNEAIKGSIKTETIIDKLKIPEKINLI